MVSNTTQRVPTIEAYVQTKRMALMLLLGAVCFTALFFFSNISRIYFYIFIPILLIATVMVVRESFDKSPRVVINQQGVFDKRIGVGVIYWKDIKRVYGVSLNNIEHVCLELYNENKYLEKRSFIINILSKLNKTTTDISPLNIVTSNLDVGYDDIFETILKGCEINSGKSST